MPRTPRVVGDNFGRTHHPLLTRSSLRLIALAARRHQIRDLSNKSRGPLIGDDRPQMIPFGRFFTAIRTAYVIAIHSKDLERLKLFFLAGIVNRDNGIEKAL